VLIAELRLNRRFWRRNRTAILEAVRAVLTDMAREATGQPDASFGVTCSEISRLMPNREVWKHG
jgi:hypothetical protein